jgi:hypothetical protein
MLPNRESGPQNQPRANVAVSVVTGAASSTGEIALSFKLVFIVSLPDEHEISRPNTKSEIKGSAILFKIRSSLKHKTHGPNITKLIYVAYLINCL